MNICRCGNTTKRKFCSYNCYWKSMKGIQPKNIKGLALGRIWRKGMFSDKIKYNSIHKFLQRSFKKQGQCEFCGKLGYTEWASKYKLYTRKIEYYFELCKSCHTYQDKAVAERVDVFASYDVQTGQAVRGSA